MKGLDRIVVALKEGRRFLIMTHEDPDTDGVGSMLALGQSLSHSGKETTLLLSRSLRPPLSLLEGADRVVTGVDAGTELDAAVVLDCADQERLGSARSYLREGIPIINIDHHETNNRYGTLHLVDPGSSSTGELVFEVIQTAGLPLGPDVAGNLFAAIQGDTGSFKYANTTARALRIAADLVDRGADPWEITRKVLDSHSLPRLRLLKAALDTVEVCHGGRIAVMTLTRRMMEETGAHEGDSEQFVDYPRFIRGVELGVLLREIGPDAWKFSLRSNTYLHAARLASRFGGGGHARAAGFSCQSPPGIALSAFLREAERFLNGASD